MNTRINLNIIERDLAKKEYFFKFKNIAYGNKKEKEATLLTFAPASSSFFAHSIFPCIAESISGVFA